MKNRICLIALIFLASAGIARAQGGCVDSPECATPVLALVGAAGLMASRWLKK
jgi:XrtJ-associated TM-motif-TM protein